MKMGWFGFWIFAAVLVASDSWVFAQGYESLLQRHKTPEEKELQRLKIEELQRKVEVLNSGSQITNSPDSAIINLHNGM